MSGDALPPGTWVNVRGVRRFMPADAMWVPVEIAGSNDVGAEFSDRETARLLRLFAAPETPIKPHRHICDCGCLLFGIENCPQCEWVQRQERRAA